MSFNFLDKTGLSYVIDKIKSKLSPVALSGDYEDLSNLPFLVSGNYYGTSTGQAALQNKAVVVSANQHFELKVGCIVAVKFDANNTYNATTSAPVTMNVNNTGAKQIYVNNTATPTGTSTTAFGFANHYINYMYDGTYWVWIGHSSDNNTTYSAMSVNELTTGTATNLRTVRADYLKQAIDELISQGGGGHDYDVSMNANKDEMTLSEDNVAKTTLPLVTEYIGTRANWNNLSASQQAKYRRVTFLGESGSNNYQLSHIGMVIHSTTLNSELLVQEIYGSDTHWIQHTGYFLRGATSGVVANQLQEDGGEDTHTLTINEMPSHSHTTGISGSVAGALNSGTSCANVLFDQTTGKNTTSTGGGQPHNNVPKYKNVYIWERVS